MADRPQDAPRYAGHVVRRVLLRHNIAIDTETAQLVADALQPRSAPVRPPGRRADAGVFPPLTAPLCSDRAGAGLPGPAARRWRTWRSR